MDFSGSEVAVVAACVLLGGWFVERFAVPRWRPSPYFRFGFPLGANLVPIPSAPKGEGTTASVGWVVRDDEVHFWADPGQRTAPGGMHGKVVLIPTRSGVQLAVTWSPPLASVGALVWVAFLGGMRGELPVAAAIVTLLAVAIGLVYRQAALRAAAELRRAFAQEDETP